MWPSSAARRPLPAAALGLLLLSHETRSGGGTGLVTRPFCANLAEIALFTLGPFVPRWYSGGAIQGFQDNHIK